MNRTIHYIYAITNLVNGKKYIGYTKRPPEQRWMEHLSVCARKNEKSMYSIHRAIIKYGVDNFRFDVLFCSLDADYTLNEAEPYFISEYKTLIKECGYNLTSGGDSPEFSEESLKKMSESRSGDKNHFYGKKHTQETKEKISKRAKERNVSGERNPFYGKTHSKESVEKAKRTLGDRLKGKNHPLAKRIEINGIVFDYIKEVAEYLGVNYRSLSKVLKKGVMRPSTMKRYGIENYRFLDKETVDSEEKFQ